MSPGQHLETETSCAAGSRQLYSEKRKPVTLQVGLIVHNQQARGLVQFVLIWVNFRIVALVHTAFLKNLFVRAFECHCHVVVSPTSCARAARLGLQSVRVVLLFQGASSGSTFDAPSRLPHLDPTRKADRHELCCRSDWQMVAHFAVFAWLRRKPKS
eukprot:345223-Amphidinium_carterae.1